LVAVLSSPLYPHSGLMIQDTGVILAGEGSKLEYGRLIQNDQMQMKQYIKLFVLGDESIL
jgi:hypothetical protein